MSGMLRAAFAKTASTSPSMMSAFARPRAANCVRRAFVLMASTAARSMMMSSSLRALADSACLRPSARTFFGRSMAWLRGFGPCGFAPPRNCVAFLSEWRARPVPFWRYIFLPVALISPRDFVACVPCCRLASCQRTTLWRMSARGSRPNVASGKLTVPWVSPVRVLTSMSITSGPCCRRRR